MADLFCSNLEQLRQVSSVGLTNLTEAYIGTLRRKFIYIYNEGGQDNNETVIVPGDNPPSGRWICPQSPIIPDQIQKWVDIDKSGSKLSDLETRSASDLNDGTIHHLRLPDGVPYFDPKNPNLILSTDENGNYKLDKINYSQIDGLIPFAKVNWADFNPNMIGAESILYLNPQHFNRDSDNNVSIKLMSLNQPGIAIPGTGIETDEFARINVIYGTGEKEALEGITPMEGDVSGTHGSNVVDRLRNIPLTFFFNEVENKDGYVIALNSNNKETPFFYLTPMIGGGGSGSDLPDWHGRLGSLLTDGTKIWWGKIPQSYIKPDFAITSFYDSVSSYEIGQSTSSIQFYASYNDTVLSAILTDNIGHYESINPDNFTDFVSVHTFLRNSVGSIQFTLSVVAIDGTTKQANTSASWLAKRFYGHLSVNNDPIVIINNLQTSELSSGRSGSYSINAGATEYIYFAFPSSFGTPSFSVGGFAGGFFLVASNVQITNSYGITTGYDLWRSDNLNLGLTVVSVS